MKERVSGIFLGILIGVIVGSGTGIVGGMFGGIPGFWLFVCIGGTIGYYAAPDILRLISWFKRR